MIWKSRASLEPVMNRENGSYVARWKRTIVLCPLLKTRRRACRKTHPVLVEHSEAGSRKLCWVSMGKKLPVNAQKSMFSQQTVRTILPKSLVPLPDLLLGNWLEPNKLIRVIVLFCFRCLFGIRIGWRLSDLTQKVD